MANKTIPVEDRQIVMQRLAEGHSTRQAIEGTAIASNQTAARIAKQESHVITQLRAQYVDQINYYARDGQKDRACTLADMIWANKVLRIGTVRGATATSYGVSKNDCYITVDDWDTRLKAIKYIDMLNGLTRSTGTQVNVLQQMNHTNSGKTL